MQKEQEDDDGGAGKKMPKQAAFSAVSCWRRLGGFLERKDGLSLFLSVSVRLALSQAVGWYRSDGTGATTLILAQPAGTHVKEARREPELCVGVCACV